MNKMIKMLTVLLTMVTCLATQGFARIHPAYLQEPGHCNGTTSSHRWMATIPDSRPLALLSIPGTHDTMAHHGGEQFQCQTMSLETQLESGIRALDIRCRHVSNEFLIYHAFVYQHVNFDAIMQTCAAFLEQNPTETILMRIKKEWISEGNSQSFEQTFVQYTNKYLKHMWLPKVDQDVVNITLGEVRGKVVILQDFNSHHHHHGENKYEAKKYGPQWKDTVIQDDFTLITIWSLYSKWTKIKDHLYRANASLATSLGANPDTPAFYVNFLSGSVGVKPYFCASGHTGWGTDQPRQYFGLINVVFSPYRYEDFPRERCMLGGRFCLVYFEGTNILTYNRLKMEHFRYVGIVYADFPGCGLIQAIIDVNKNL